MFTVTNILEAAMLAIALSMDALVASFGYGVNKIKIPFLSAQIINVVCTAILAAAIFLGVAARSFIPQSVTTALCFTILLILGIIKLFDSITKRIIRKRQIQKDIQFKLASFSFILHIYSAPEDADIDASRVLSPTEAAYLAVALSLDGMSVGFGTGLTVEFPVMIILFSLVFGFLDIMGGYLLGKKVSEKLKFDLSWLSGAILIVLAVMKLF